MATPYTYEHLANPQSGVRLLSITSIKNDEISVSLHEAADLKSEVYHCLSYTWGSPLPELQISINAHSWQSRQNLYHALKYLHKVLPDETKAIWIDAICIDQGNEEEKGIQIKRMHEIYAGAKSVIVWLGPSVRGQDPAIVIPRFESAAEKIVKDFKGIEGLDLFHKITELEAQKRIIPLNMDNYPSIKDISADDWLAVRELVHVEYFRRQWIWQEVVAATADPIVVCGTYVLSSWSALRKTSHALSLFGDEEIIRARKAGKRIGYLEQGMTTVNFPHQLAYSRDLYRPKEGSQRMRKEFGQMVLRQHRNSFVCWDERDRLFAMVGICGFEKLADWDYNRPFRELYIHFWSDVMRRTKNINYLSYVEDAKARQDRPRMSQDLEGGYYDAQLPSWVPDLRAPLYPPSMYSVYHPSEWLNISKSLPGQSGFETESLVIDQDAGQLKFKAYLLDTIQSSAHTAIEVLKLLRDILQDPSTEEDSHEGAIGAVWWALAFFSELAENVPDGYSQAMINKSRLWLLQFPNFLPCSSILEILAHRRLVDEVIWLDTKNLIIPPSPPSGESYILLSVMEEAAITLGMRSMRIFRTKEHWIGKGPASLQAGDQVWVVPGAMMGFVLRPLEESGPGTHRFVGQAYMPGASGGELCEDLMKKEAVEVVLV